MVELTEKQCEDAIQFLNSYINTLQLFAKSMDNMLEIFKKYRVSKNFLTSFHKILYCVAKLQTFQKYSEENLKDYYKQFEDEFCHWRSKYSEVVPENYVYCSQYDQKSEKFNATDSAVQLNNANSSTISSKSNSEENSEIILNENSQVNAENVQNEIHKELSTISLPTNETNEYKNLMESESNEFEESLLKLSDFYDTSCENNNLESKIENSLNVNVVSSQDNLESLESNVSKTEKNSTENQLHEIKSNILSNTDQRDNEKLPNDDKNPIKCEIISQTRNSIDMELPECSIEINKNDCTSLNPPESKQEIVSNNTQDNSKNLSNDKINENQIDILTKNTDLSNEESVANTEVITKSIHREELSKNIQTDKNDCDVNPSIENNPEISSNNSENNSKNLSNNENQFDILTQCTDVLNDDLVKNNTEPKRSSENLENNSIININNGEAPKCNSNVKSTINNALLDVNESSSSLDDAKMAIIEAQLLRNSSIDSIYEKDTIENDDNINDFDKTEKNSDEDIIDFDELLSDIDVSDEELKIKYKQAIKNIYNDSASSESIHSDSEESIDSMNKYENQVLQHQSPGKIVKLNIYDEIEQSNGNNVHSSNEELHVRNLRNKFQEKCVVKLQRIDFSKIKNPVQINSLNTTDDISKLLNISSLTHTRRRIYTSSSSKSNESLTRSKKKYKRRRIDTSFSSESNESCTRPKKRYKSTKKKRSSSNSTSESSSNNSDSSINTDIDCDDSDNDNNSSGWIPDISDSSSISDKTTDESSTDSSDEKKKVRKKQKLHETKNVKKENEAMSHKKKGKNISSDDWRKNPLLRFNLKDNNKDRRTFSSNYSDVEIVEDDLSDDDDVIINEDINDNNKKKKRQISLLEVMNRKKHVTLLISSESDMSDESDVEDADKTKPRKRRRKVMSYQELAEATKKANEEEKERMVRLTQRHSMSLKLSNEQGNIDVPDTLVLEYNMETKKPRIKIHPELYKVLKDHQKEGVKFMWDSCYESVDLISKNCGSGCVLAHCMGLGKTLQVITFVYTLFSYPETLVKRVLILAPITTIKNWEREFNRWLSKLKKLFNIDSIIGRMSREIRDKKIETWMKKGGVFIMNYSLFRTLTNIEIQKKSNENGIEVPKIKHKQFYHKALLNPGPDLLVCDEGHTLKNSKSLISQCISEMKTARRIMLTGTPMQNNLDEYYCMINLVKPNLLGSAKEFANRFGNPITKGQSKDSSASEIRMMKRRAHVLHKKLSGVVQRVEGSILTPYLPSLVHYIVFIKMSNEQVTIYKKFIEIGKQISSRLLPLYQRAKKISTHPICLYTQSRHHNSKLHTSTDNDIDNSQKDVVYDDPLKDLTWYTSLYDKTQLEHVECGTKLMVFFHILNQCELYGDKLLAFTTSINILNNVEFFLNKAPIKDYICNTWVKGLDYVRVDGGTSSELRDQIYENFNDINNPRLRLLIATTKVTGLGLNLFGANRIVILDTSWNPSDDMQSVYRIYRFGQRKDCYVYSLVSLGTMEEKIYERCVTKQAISCRVVDQQQVDRHYLSKGNVIKEFFTFVNYDQLERPAPNVPSDRVLATALQKYPDYIFRYHEHDKLLQNQEDEELDESEREAAWQEFILEEERLKNSYLRSMEFSNNQQNPNRSMELPNYLHPMNFSNNFGNHQNLLRISNNIHGNITNNQDIPSTSAASDPTNRTESIEHIISDTEYILSDTLENSDLQNAQPSIDLTNKNDGNTFNDNLMRIENVESLNEDHNIALQQHTVSDNDDQIPEPEIESNYVVLLDD